MRLSALLFFAFGIAALSRAAENDPFAAYHDAIERQLSALSARLKDDPPLQPQRLAGPVQSSHWNGRGDALRSALSRLARYRPEMEAILEQEGVPKSLVAVVLVESGAQPFALSPKQARGLWQFIPETARQYGLTVSANKDERVHVQLATQAAARYLRDLYAKFRDWELALAAYNAGPDAVDKAMQRGRGSTYAEISAARLLPEETRNYVPAVLSAMSLLGTGSN